MTNRQQEILIDAEVIPNFVADLSIDAIRSRFINAARSIMLEHKLIRAEYCWEITALELYLYRSGVWEDRTTHRARAQLESGTWYIHRDGILPATRMGIDITAGSHSPEIHAGLLVAAIGGTDGSGCAVNTILRGRSEGKRSWDYSEAERKFLLEDVHNTSICSGPPNLRLVRRSAPKEAQLWIGPRKFGKKQSANMNERLRDASLRIATFPWANPLMKPLDKAEDTR